MYTKLALAVVLALGLLGCGVADVSELDADDGTEGSGLGSATPVFTKPAGDYASTVKVSNGMTLTLHTELAWRAGAVEQLVLKGTTSQDITFVQGFIPDDKFGDVTQLGKRSFELVFSNASDFDTVIAGMPFYLVLTTHTATGDHPFVAQFYVSPRLVAPAGSSSARLALGPAITPIYVTDNPIGIRFRGTVTATAAAQSLTVTAAASPTLTQDGPRAWHFDWLYDGFATSAQSGAPVVAKGKFGATTSTRTGTIEIRLAQVGLAAGNSPDDIFGFPTCDPAVQACIQALPAGTIDFGSCGSFFAVRNCN
jgi:hypothetical protein